MATKSRASGIFLDIEGTTEFKQILNDIPTQIQRTGINSAARLAAKPIISEARGLVSEVSKGTDEGFSKAAYVSRSIRAVTNSKRSIPGVRVMAKGPAVPVRGSRYGSWNVQGYLKLLASGSYLTPNRGGRGRFRGYGNFIHIAQERRRKESSEIFRRNLMVSTERAIDRSIRKYQRLAA